MSPTNKPARRLLPLLLAGLLSACATTPATEAPMPDAAAGDPLTGLATLAERVREEPRNHELRAYYLRQREHTATELLAAAEQAQSRGDFARAEQLFRQAQQADEGNPRALAGLALLADEQRRLVRLVEADIALARGETGAAERLTRSVLAEAPANARAQRLLREVDERRARERAADTPVPSGPLAKRVSLQFRDAPLRAVFEALSHAAGVNFVFDREIRDDALVSLVVRDTAVSEVIQLLAATQQIDSKLVNANSVLIYPATPAKQREYQELVSRSFYLAHAEAKQAQALLKQLVKTRDLFIDEKLNLVVIKDTPEAIRLAERLITALDVAEPEVMLEVEVLEVSRSKLRNLGLEFPNEIGFGLLQGAAGGALVPGNINLRDTSEAVPFAANPAAVLRLRSEDGDTSTLANPRIRVKNRTAAKIHIGEKLPVFTTTSTANVGVSASVSYLDVGLKLDVEPSVTLDDQVAIKVALEVSNIVREIAGPEGSLAYQLGTRSASTTLRLRNGETQVLAGLINDEDRLSARRFPGLGDLPLVGRLFSANNDSSIKTEIVLLITPRIVRNVVPPVLARDNLPSGTEASVGAAPLRIGATPPGALAMRGTGETVAALPAALLPPPTPAMAPAAPEGLAVQLLAPSTARAGALLTLAVDLGGQGQHGGGAVDVAYDATLLEPVGFAGPGEGQATAALTAGALPTKLSLVFQVKPGAAGPAAVAVTGVSLDVGGQRVVTPVSASAMVTIVP